MLCSAQIRAKTPMGIEVLLYEDGTWSAIDTKSSKTNNSVKEPKSTCDVNIKQAPSENSRPGLIVTFQKVANQAVSILRIQSMDRNFKMETDREIILSLENGEKLTFANDSSYNSGYYSIYFGKNYRNINELDAAKTGMIKMISYVKNGQLIEESISEENAKQLMEGLNCVAQ